MKVGDFVCFTKDAPPKSEYCGVWSWAHGLLLAVNEISKKADVLGHDGNFYIISLEHVQRIEEDHWHPGMLIDDVK